MSHTTEPRQMKLWEVVSGFREFTNEVAAVFSSERWRGGYGATLSRFDELVRTQDRAVLDSLVPLDLTRDPTGWICLHHFTG